MEFNATFIVAFISFVIFIVIMNYILYKPVNNIVEQRKRFIDDNYNVAKNNSEKKQTLLKERDDKIKSAHAEIKQKTTIALNKAKEKRNTLTQNAKNEAKADIEKSLTEKRQESENAKQELKVQVVNLAQIISDKFIQTPDKIEADYELIENIMQG